MVNELIRNIVKDFKVEFRSRLAINLTFSFAGIITISISLVLSGTLLPVNIQAILLWIILFFSAMNGLSHIFVREEEQGTTLFLTLNSSAYAILLSKMIFNVIFFFSVEIIITLLYIFFIGIEINSTGFFIISIISGGFAIATTTTILAAMVAKAGGKGSLFTVISFPLLLPILWVAISCTHSAINPAIPQEYGNILFLLAFSGVVIAISFILFPFIWFEE